MNMSISNLQKSEIFANVDGNRTASSRQLYAVAKHFGKVGGNNPTESYRLSKIYSAILLKFQNENAETPITHADVVRFFESKSVPKKFVSMITSKPVKAKKIVKDTPKPKATPAKKIQADTSELSEFKSRFDAITKRQDETDKKLATFEAKLDIIMAYLETDPDA
jgi:CRISPR/Cas system CSM-associated protein Csm2 small subunit